MRYYANRLHKLRGNVSIENATSFVQCLVQQPDKFGGWEVVGQVIESGRVEGLTSKSQDLKTVVEAIQSQQSIYEELKKDVNSFKASWGRKIEGIDKTLEEVSNAIDVYKNLVQPTQEDNFESEMVNLTEQKNNIEESVKKLVLSEFSADINNANTINEYKKDMLSKAA